MAVWVKYKKNGKKIFNSKKTFLLSKVLKILTFCVSKYF